MLDYFLVVNRQGKVRLARWYHHGLTIAVRERLSVDACTAVLQRVRSSSSKRNAPCNVLSFPAPHRIPSNGRPSSTATSELIVNQLVYRRYASLFFIMALQPGHSVLLALDLIHRFVETLDKYFGSVCELDLVFNFHKAYYALDEMFLGGRCVESSARMVLGHALAVDEQELMEKEAAMRALTPKFLQ